MPCQSVSNPALRREEEELRLLEEEEQEQMDLRREARADSARASTYRNAFESRKGQQYSLTKDLKKAREIQRKKEKREK